jgi:hypothetical protein
MIDGIGPGIAAPGIGDFVALPSRQRSSTGSRDPSIVLRSRGVAYAP